MAETPFDALVFELLRAGRWPDLGFRSTRPQPDGGIVVATAPLLVWARAVHGCDATLRAVGWHLAVRLGFHRVAGRRAWYVVPPLAAARRAHDRASGHRFAWPDCEAWRIEVPAWPVGETEPWRIPHE